MNDARGIPHGVQGLLSLVFRPSDEELKLAAALAEVRRPEHKEIYKLYLQKEALTAEIAREKSKLKRMKVAHFALVMFSRSPNDLKIMVEDLKKNVNTFMERHSDKLPEIMTENPNAIKEMFLRIANGLIYKFPDTGIDLGKAGVGMLTHRVEVAQNMLDSTVQKLQGQMVECSNRISVLEKTEFELRMQILRDFLKADQRLLTGGFTASQSGRTQEL